MQNYTFQAIPASKKQRNLLPLFITKMFYLEEFSHFIIIFKCQTRKHRPKLPNLKG